MDERKRQHATAKRLRYRLRGGDEREQRRQRREANALAANATQRAYREANREAFNETQRAYRQANQEALNAARNAHRETNAPAANETQRAYRQANQEALNAARNAHRETNAPAANETQRAYREANQEALNAARKAHREANASTANEKQQKARAKKRAQEEAQFGQDYKDNFRLTEEQLEEIMRKLTSGKTVEERKKAHQAVFRGMGNNPLKALLLYYLNSGGSRFGQWKHYSEKHDGTEIDIEALEKEILGEGLTEEELDDMYQSFGQRHSYVPGSYMGCSACGFRRFEENFEEVDLLDPRVEKFKYDLVERLQFESKYNDPKSRVVIYTDENNSKEVNAWDVISIYRHSDGSYYHLHPELVSTKSDGTQTVMLCQDCLPDKYTATTNSDGTVNEGRAVRPSLSIAAGVDFGYFRRLGLAPLNFHEKTILSLNRLFVAVLKVTLNTSGRVNYNTSSKLRAHAVMFAQDSLSVLGKYFQKDADLTSLENMIKDVLLHLIDGKGRCDFLAKRILLSSTIFGRWWNFLSYMRVLKVVSSEFGHIPIPTQEEMQARCELAKTSIVDEAEIVEDRGAVMMEAQIGSDVVEEERQYIPEDDEVEVDDGAEAEVAEDIPVDVTYVFDDPVANSGNNERISNKAYLTSISDMAMLNYEDMQEEAPMPDLKSIAAADGSACSDDDAWFDDEDKDDGGQEDARSVGSASSYSSAGDACFSPLDDDVSESGDMSDTCDMSQIARGNTTHHHADSYPNEGHEGEQPGSEDKTAEAIERLEGSFLRIAATQAGATLASKRENVPVNEFTAVNLLGKTFPSTFMLGVAYGPKRVRLSSKQLNHLLHQFTNVPAEDFRLLGYLQNVISSDMGFKYVTGLSPLGSNSS